MRVDLVSARIEDKVPDLAGRTLGAGDFADLVEKNRMPQQTPAAYVLPGGYTGGEAQASAGLFVQTMSETVIVIVAVRVAGDPLHSAAVAQASPIVRQVIEGVAGWGPDEAPGVFVLSRGELVGAKDGLLIFQIDFTLMDQLRITP